MWFYKIVCVFILATGTVQANYYVSNFSTHWIMTNCSLAEPQLAYNNTSFYVNESLGLQFNDTDVWIGYRLAKIPFLFLGCGLLNTLRTYTVTSIGFCFNACGGERFGITLPLDNILSNTTTFECQCGSNIKMVSNCERQTGPDECKHKSCAAIFIPINVTGDETQEFPNVNNTRGDCMQYYYPYFVWRQCTLQSPIKVMCSRDSYTDSASTAIIFEDPFATNWIHGNNACLKNSSHPSFVSSINNTAFNYQQQQYHWTGILRSIAVIKRSMAANESTYPMEQFAFLDRNSSLLGFASSVNKRALCVEEPGTATTTQAFNTSVYSTKPPTTVSTSASSTAYIPSTDHSPPKDSDKFPAERVGIGLLVGILFVVGIIVVIVVLRRRGILPCKLKKNVDNPSDGKPACSEKLSNKEYDHHNYFILEKTAQSANYDTDQYNTAGEPTEDTVGNDIYNSIQDPEEPYDHIKDVNGDYDYTTHDLNTGGRARKPDNVYNKLKINIPGDYDHIGRLGCSQANVSCTDYDTTSVAMAHRNDDLSDYNRIPQQVNAERGNRTIDLKRGDYAC